MRAVIDFETAKTLHDEGHFYVMHRFDDIHAFIEKAQGMSIDPVVSVSIGVQDHALDFIRHAPGPDEEAHVDYVTIDIAHGHSVTVSDAIKNIREYLPGTYIIAGNVATPQAVEFLEEAGADAVKIGIGQGNVCTTKDKTGFTAPMFTCVQECAKGANDCKLIADGGIRCNGDVAKALVAGADAVMVGSQFSACIDSPAETVNREGAMYKRYFGSASVYNKRNHRHVEGIMKEIPCNGMSIIEKIDEMRHDLQSAISYAGGTSLKDLLTVDYIHV
jgi:GMP reductase